jgi:hypothetical protein
MTLMRCFDHEENFGSGGPSVSVNGYRNKTPVTLNQAEYISCHLAEPSRLAMLILRSRPPPSPPTFYCKHAKKQDILSLGCAGQCAWARQLTSSSGAFNFMPNAEVQSFYLVCVPYSIIPTLFMLNPIPFFGSSFCSDPQKTSEYS